MQKEARRSSEPNFHYDLRNLSHTLNRNAWYHVNKNSSSVIENCSVKFLRSSARRLSRTLSQVQTTLETVSQKFRKPTRRRHRLKNESPCTPVTPDTRSKRILGRTPTKLYSPFGIETPRKIPQHGKENDRKLNNHAPYRTASTSSYEYSHSTTNNRRIRLASEVHMRTWQFVHSRTVTRRSLRN